MLPAKFLLDEDKMKELESKLLRKLILSKRKRIIKIKAKKKK